MSDAEELRLKSEHYLRKAAAAADLGERGRLLSQAMYWNEQARVAELRRRMARTPG